MFSQFIWLYIVQENTIKNIFQNAICEVIVFSNKTPIGQSDFTIARCTPSTMFFYFFILYMYFMHFPLIYIYIHIHFFSMYTFFLI
jgi:hypothetical protein